MTLLGIPHFRYSVAAVPITSIALLAKKSNSNVGVKQPSAASNCSYFDWTSTPHISLGSGMPKHSKIVPITAGRPTSQEPHEQVLVPIRNGSCVQISFSELLLRYSQQQQAQETAQAETSRPKRRKIIYLPTRSSDDSCSA